MGKDSLIISTSKKKSAPKKEASAAKAKTVKKPKTKTAVKVTSKAKAPGATATAKGKAATRSKTTPKVKKSVAASPKKQVTIRELLAKKFDTWTPDTLFSIQDAAQKTKLPSAPPIIDTADPAEASRLKALLLKKYDYDMLVKAAAEKAAAEKAAAEKAAAEKVAAMKKPSDPAEIMMKYGIAGFVLLVLLVIGASFLNTGKFYVKQTGGAIEIWQGKFAPKGSELVISLPGAHYTQPIQEVYTKADVYPMIFNYYIQKADTLLDVPGLPDFEGVRSYLNQALEYGTTAELAQAATSRLNTIDLMVLLYKADVAASKDSIEDLQSALTYWKEASKLEMDPLLKERIIQKTAAASARLETLKAQAVQAEEAVQNPEPAEEARTASD